MQRIIKPTGNPQAKTGQWQRSINLLKPSGNFTYDQV
jgi:hypothetical protein